MLHMSLNPTSMARQRQREDHDRLQGECERLRGLVHALERGGPIPADLEAASSLPSSKEVAGRCPHLALWSPERNPHRASGLSGWTEPTGPCSQLRHIASLQASQTGLVIQVCKQLRFSQTPQNKLIPFISLYVAH